MKNLEKDIYRNDSECSSSDDEVTGGRYRTDSGNFESDNSDLEDDCKKGVIQKGKKHYTSSSTYPKSCKLCPAATYSYLILGS
jgi:hypothetical protein